MRRNIYNSIYYCILGLILIVISTMAIIQQEQFLMRVFDVFGWILIINGLHELNVFCKRRFKGELINIIGNIGVGIFILAYTAIPIRLLFVIFAVYITINGLIKFISYLNYKKDKVSKRFPVLCGALFLILYGLGLLLGKYVGANDMMIFIGIYGLLLGINYIIDGVFTAVPQQHKDSLKRRIRIPVPIFISALVPRVMMDYINERLKVEPKEKFLNNQKHSDVEIFIHVSPDGFGTIGHCDICINNQVISYGNYDYDSIRLFESIGDGVLFEAPRDSYIPFCIEDSNKTIFSYGVRLTVKQLASVKREIQKLKENTYRWYPRSSKNKNDCNDYASRLYLRTGALFYKFKRGRYKTYFVLGSNCVKLAETIMGKAGLDIIDLNGIISPGTYQNYLEKEYQRANGIVVSKNIYNKYTINDKS